MVVSGPSAGALIADAGQVRAFRLAGHNLAARLPPGSLLAAAGACGVQNTAPEAAALALHARVSQLEPGDVERALEAERTLVQAWSLRAAMVVFPRADAAVFTAGLLPDGELALRAFMLGAEPGLRQVGMSAGELVERTAAALAEALPGRARTKNELGVELAERIGRGLAARQRDAWLSPTYIAAEQSLGETLVRFALPVTALRGLVCFGARRGQERPLVVTGEWLGAPLPHVSPGQARAELVRRYLHCYGPSTPEHLAAWAGIAPEQAARMWALVERELVAVSLAGRTAWLHQRDVPRFASPPTPEGIRLLPPHDPLLQLRDRALLVPDRGLHRRIWRAAGSPGVVLAGGQVVATWRARKAGRRLRLAVEPCAPLAQALRSDIEGEAAALAPFRGCASVEVELAPA